MSGFPTGPQIRVQILEIIKDGKIHTKDEVVEKSAKHFKLTKEQKLKKIRMNRKEILGIKK